LGLGCSWLLLLLLLLGCCLIQALPQLLSLLLERLQLRLQRLAALRLLLQFSLR
jgi:hypothetical protein